MHSRDTGRGNSRGAGEGAEGRAGSSGSARGQRRARGGAPGRRGAQAQVKWPCRLKPIGSAECTRVDSCVSDTLVWTRVYRTHSCHHQRPRLELHAARAYHASPRGPGRCACSAAPAHMPCALARVAPIRPSARARAGVATTLPLRQQQLLLRQRPERRWRRGRCCRGRGGGRADTRRPGLGLLGVAARFGAEGRAEGRARPARGDCAAPRAG